MSQHGRGIYSFSCREVCDIIYYRVTSQIQTKHNDDGSILETIEDQIAEFEEEIGLKAKSNKQTAMDLLREDMIRRGIDPDSLPDVELRQEWFKEDPLGDEWGAFQAKKQQLAKTEVVEDAGLDIEF